MTGDQPEPTAVEPTAEQYAALGRYTAALLGARKRDRGLELLDTIAGHVAGPLNTNGKAFPFVAFQTTAELTLWRAVADELGIQHDRYND